MKPNNGAERCAVQVHSIAPVYDANSRVLILGSFPSVRSREVGFFYGHPQNRFWVTLAHLLGTETPTTVDARRSFLLTHGIALWDVIASCEITGSSDASIKHAVPNDIGQLLQQTHITHIFTNGGAADRLWRKYLQPRTGIEAHCLPSTSPANAAWTQERLDKAWGAVALALQTTSTTEEQKT